MIPYYNENPRYSFPIVNTLLIVLNLGIFIYMFFQGDQSAFYNRWAFVPEKLWSGNLPSFPTLITYSFLHGSWGHLLSNMLFLFIFGNNIEDVLGHGKYLRFYLLAALWGVLLHATVNSSDSHFLVGASGAISAVLTVYMFLFPREKIRVLLFFFIPVKLASVLFLLFWVGTQVYMGYQSITQNTLVTQTAYFAHIGGIVYGLIFSLFNAYRLKAKWKSKIKNTKGI